MYGLISIRNNQDRPASLAPDLGNPPPNQDGVVDDFALEEFLNKITKQNQTGKGQEDKRSENERGKEDEKITKKM